MSILIGPPPVKRAARRDYSELFLAACTNVGDWVSISAEEVTGDRSAHKQNALHNYFNNRGVRIQTSCQQERVFVRVL